MQNTPQPQPSTPAPTPTPTQTSNDPTQFGQYSNWAKDQMSKGYTADQLHQFAQQQGITDYGNTPQQPAQQGNDGNWFTHLLPTIGGIGGSILGGLATAGLGGEVIGGAGGSALGQGIENALEGKNAIQGNDLSAALGGATGAGIGGVVGKIGGKLGEGLISKAENIRKGATQAGADASKVAEEQTLQNQYNIADRLKGSDHLAFGTNLDAIDKLGYNKLDPNAMKLAGEAGYHPEDLSLNTIYDQTLKNAAPVDMSKFGNSLYKTMQDSGTQDLATSPVGKALTDFHTKTANAYNTDNTLNLPNNMSAADVRKLQQSVGNEMGNQQTLINNAGRDGNSNTQAEADHATLSNLYQQLGDKVKTPEVNAAIAARQTSPEELQQLTDKFGPVHGQQIADTINNAKSAQDLLDPMQQYMQMSKIGNLGIDNIVNNRGSTASIAAAKAALKGDPSVVVAGQPINPTGFIHDVSQTPGALGKTLAITKHVANNPGLLNTLGRMGRLTNSVGTIGAKDAATAADGSAIAAVKGRALPGLAPVIGAGLGAGNAALTDQSNANNGTIGGIMQPGQPNQSVLGAATSPSGGLSRNDLLTLAMYSPSAFGALMTPSADNQGKVSAANTAEQALSGLGNAPSGGIMSQIGGSLGIGSAGAYQRQAQSAAQQVAAALPGTDAKAIEGELTNYMAGGSNIQDAVQKLMANLQAVKQNNTNGAYQSLMNYSPSVIGASGVQPQ